LRRIGFFGIDVDLALKRRLEAGSAPRGGEVALVAALGDAGEVELRLPGCYRLDAALRGALKTAPGVRWLEEMG
jgi:DNA polymerase-3 subunit alpha